jgi:hypothetical protein
VSSPLRLAGSRLTPTPRLAFGSVCTIGAHHHDALVRVTWRFMTVTPQRRAAQCLVAEYRRGGDVCQRPVGGHAEHAVLPVSRVTGNCCGVYRRSGDVPFGYDLPGPLNAGSFSYSGEYKALRTESFEYHCIEWLVAPATVSQPEGGAAAQNL